MPTPDRTPVRSARAFALPELLAAVAVCATLLAALAVLAEGSRRTARLGDDLAKFRFIGAATASYAADNADHVWSLSWQGGETYDVGHDDLATAPTDNEAAANQAIYLLRTRTGRDDLPRVPSWLPYAFYNHLVLVDYLDTQLPDRTFISSADKNRQAWADDPECFDQGCFGLLQPPPSETNRRWPYSASFSIPPAFWDRTVEPANRIQQASAHDTYLIPAAADLGPARLADVAFPSQKVLLHDSFAWHFGQRVTYCTQREARLPLLFVDGSVHVRAAIESNPGWRPSSPTSPAYTQFGYSPRSWEPPVPPGSTGFVNGNFRWTRGGILGRDYGGEEIDTNP